MITNERQYRISRSQLEKFKKAIESFDFEEVIREVNSKKLAKAQLDALQSEYDILYEQVQEYERLRSGAVEMLKASSLEELPCILIRSRIARGLSQKDLASRLGLKEQQIQRYEAEEYASANLSRLGEVAKALDISIREIAEFEPSKGEVAIGKKLEWDQFPM